MMQRRTPKSGSLPAVRSGFTLTEMLVATALVVLIMLMFAQIYGSAVGSIREQRGLANNDQKARILETTLRQDLQAMTYRQPSFPYGDVRGIVPLNRGDELIVDPVNQRGYFYYSENNPLLDFEDVLQFTVMQQMGQRGESLDRKSVRPFVGRARNLGIANEPDDDDGDGSNAIGASRTAEVSYFLRHRNLYRRVLLLRDPLPGRIPVEPQPTAALANGQRYQFNPTNRNYTTGRLFYEDFDYSATRMFDDESSSPGTSYLWFNSVDSLANHVGLRSNPIALPQNRFGFFNNPTVSADHGMPREYIDQDPANNGDFIGRFTHRETSDSDYGYPGIQNNVNQRSNTLTALDAQGTVPGLEDGTRVAEDIILTNVEAFNVELLDDSAARFVSLGSNDAVDYAASNVANGQYGPRTSGNRIYDTWHPLAAMGNGNPPFRPFIESGAGTTWAANTAATTSDILLLPTLPGSRSMVYRVATAGTTGALQPEFPPEPGRFIRDGSVVWECLDNRIGLKAIRITIRFKDEGSNLLRQLTIVHSFVE